MSSMPENYHRINSNFFSDIEGVDSSTDDLINSGWIEDSDSDRRLIRLLDMYR